MNLGENMGNDKCNWRIRGESLQLRVNGGKDINGKRIVYTKSVSDRNLETGRRLTDVQRNKLWHEFNAEVDRGNVRKPATLTLKDIVELHIKNDPSRSPETTRGYENIVKIHLSDTFGKRKASSLTRADIQEWVIYLQTGYKSNKDKLLSSKSVRNIYGLVNAAYRTCIKLEILDTNPCINVTLPEREKKKARYLKQEDAIKFMAALMEVPDAEANYKVATLIGLSCGLRRGEICGLDESSYDPDRRMLSIEQARYPKKGGGQLVKKPKSEDSKRIVAVSGFLKKEIDHLILLNKKNAMMLGSQWRGSPALIKGYLGGNMRPDALWDWLNDFLIRNDIPHIGVHGLRHTYASSLMALGVDLKSISDQLGHANIQITNEYIHQFEDAKTDIADRIEALYVKNVDKMWTDEKKSG